MKTEEYKIEIHQFGKLPAYIPDGVIYVARNGEVDEGVAFTCPCGCGQNLWLPFGEGMEGGSDGPRSMRWIIEDAVLCIYPSVHLGYCGSHFHIIMNKVNWC